MTLLFLKDPLFSQGTYSRLVIKYNRIMTIKTYDVYVKHHMFVYEFSTREKKQVI